MANLFGNRGGRASSAAHIPSDAEAFGLTTGLVMYFSWRMDNTHPLLQSPKRPSCPLEALLP